LPDKQINEVEMEDRVPQDAIDIIAQHISERNNKAYPIPVKGETTKSETPQIFEILPFDQIDNSNRGFFAVDGSTNSHAFYNGVALGLYRAGYVSYRNGKSVRMNTHEDPVILGHAYTPKNILITCEEHLMAIYDELLVMEPVSKLLKFFEATSDQVFPYNRDAICSSISSLLGFCQEILEWALIYEISQRPDANRGDFILRDGTLRSLNIKQTYIAKLGKYLSKDKGILLLGITKNSPIKMELTYTFRQIDSYLQDKLKAKYPFIQKDPKRQKLCCWFEVPDCVLANAYGGSSSGMYAKKAIIGGRGTGLFFAARLDYVEKLQNYDWIVADVNIFDAIPGIAEGKLERDMPRLQTLFLELTRLTQEHYILGYPYPLVEAHNFIAITRDFKEEVINRVKQAMYSSEHMDHIDIENMFLGIHSRF
jgi:hypothetical protein